jgi:hypothetical protein
VYVLPLFSAAKALLSSFDFSSFSQFRHFHLFCLKAEAKVAFIKSWIGKETKRVGRAAKAELGTHCFCAENQSRDSTRT